MAPSKNAFCLVHWHKHARTPADHSNSTKSHSACLSFKQSTFYLYLLQNSHQKVIFQRKTTRSNNKTVYTAQPRCSVIGFCCLLLFLLSLSSVLLLLMFGSVYNFFFFIFSLFYICSFLVQVQQSPLIRVLI